MLEFEHRHIFHAQSVAFAAHIRRQKDYYIPAVACSCLPSTGGVGSAEGWGENCNEMISFTHGSSKVVGDFEDQRRAREFTHGNYFENQLATVTHTEASLSELTIKVGGRTFCAEFLQARMNNRSDIHGPTEFRYLSTTFHGLTVDKVKLHVTTHCDVLETYNTRSKLYDAYATDPLFKRQYGHFFSGTGSHCEPPAERLPPTGPIFGTIVSGLQFQEPMSSDFEIRGNVLKIGNFGTIHFGEVLIKENHRQLTLLRFQLGCPDGGECSAVDIGANGTRIPPKFDDSN